MVKGKKSKLLTNHSRILCLKQLGDNFILISAKLGVKISKIVIYGCFEIGKTSMKLTGKMSDFNLGSF